MFQLINAPLCAAFRDAWGGWAGVSAALDDLGLDGLEGIWAGEEIPPDFPPAMLVGYHLTFLPDWLDFYREDKAALRRKFGSLDAAYHFYGGSSPELLVRLYREDLERAATLGAEYVVFHVSDASIEEGYTFSWLHTDEEVILAAAELIDRAVGGTAYPFELLLENQWWAGFTFTDPEKTALLLESVHYPKKGVMLDTGHLMVTDPSIRTEAEGAAHIQEILNRHSGLCGSIRGVHLHQSLSGQYIREHTGKLPKLPSDYLERYAMNYGHIQQIDRHQPWTDPRAAAVVEQISPRWLTHELSGLDQKTKFQAARRQLQTLREGGLSI